MKRVVDIVVTIWHRLLLQGCKDEQLDSDKKK